MIKFLYVPLALVLFVACSKYEEGPDFSLQSRKNRISNNWTVRNVYDNNEDATLNYCSQYPSYQLNIGSDFQYTATFRLYPEGLHVETGTWKFNSDKTHIILTSSAGEEADYEILRLEKNDLRLKRMIDAGCERKMHLWPKSES